MKSINLHREIYLKTIQQLEQDRSRLMQIYFNLINEMVNRTKP